MGDVVRNGLSWAPPVDGPAIRKQIERIARESFLTCSLRSMLPRLHANRTQCIKIRLASSPTLTSVFMFNTLALFSWRYRGCSGEFHEIIGHLEAARYAPMSMEQVFTARTITTLIAAGVVAFVAFALIRSMIRRGMPVVWEILQITTGMACMSLVALSSRGNIGPWGTWAGFGGGFAVLLIALYVSRSAKKTGCGSSTNS